MTQRCGIELDINIKYIQTLVQYVIQHDLIYNLRKDSFAFQTSQTYK